LVQRKREEYRIHIGKIYLRKPIILPIEYLGILIAGITILRLTLERTFRARMIGYKLPKQKKRDLTLGLQRYAK